MSSETKTKTIKESTEQKSAPVMDSVKAANNNKIVNKANIEEDADNQSVKICDSIKESKESDVVSDNIKECEVLDVISRKTVDTVGGRIRLVDRDEDSGLDLFCYIKCSPTDSDFIRKCRGIVFHGDDIVMQAFPYTIEYNETEIDIINSHIKDFSKCSFFDAHEGALVRLFYFDDKWYITTHRKLNAFRSKWASKESFGVSFKKALESEMQSNVGLSSALPDGENLLDRFYSILDNSKQYMFLIKNTIENRIVCDAPDRPTMYHVGTFINGELSLEDQGIHVPFPKRHSFLNNDDLLKYVNTVDCKKIQGVIAFTPDNVQFKILHKEYQDLFKARGNEPSIKFRYLQVRMNKKYIDMLYRLYPDQICIFEEYENTLYEIARGIYRAYVQRFIKKKYVTVPREEFKIIKDCHTWHLTERSENRMSIQQVIKIMNQQTPTDLNHMIRRFRAEQIRKNDETETTRPRSNSGISNISDNTLENPEAPNHTISPLIIGVGSSNTYDPKYMNIGQPVINGGVKSYNRTATISINHNKPRLLKNVNTTIDNNTNSDIKYRKNTRNQYIKHRNIPTSISTDFVEFPPL
jgi:hypothetical protein